MLVPSYPEEWTGYQHALRKQGSLYPSEIGWVTFASVTVACWLCPLHTPLSVGNL